ncbi:MAG: hypothetical protein JWM61_290 [Micrococcaceae bacterium]|nr:hypothetical protein [Micrococcaceae bacterium]
MNYLHPAQTLSAPPTAADALDASDSTLPPLSFTGSLNASVTPVVPVVPVDSHGQDSEDFDEELSAEDIRALPIKRLRVMVNQVYKLMDTTHPPYGVLDRYDVLVDELEHRAHQAAERGAAYQAKEAFRNNPLYCRFELFIDGRPRRLSEVRDDRRTTVSHPRCGATRIP